MITRLARWTGLLAGSLAIIVALGSPAASAVNFFDDVCYGDGSQSAACSGDGKDNISGTNGIILRAASLISIIAGIAAVFIIIIAGFMFITAGGDTNKAGNARKTIIYAVVGLVVIALARTIVAFVVSRL